MAKHIRKFAPGYADVTPTPDWCEFIVFEKRQNPDSERSAIYGHACGRFCLNAPAKHVMIDRWSGGGIGWGSCCCMSGQPAGGGMYMRGCYSAYEGKSYCYVVGSSGCCQPAAAAYGCFTLIKDQDTCCQSCNIGGMCGVSACYFDYCCNRSQWGDGGRKFAQGPDAVCGPDDDTQTTWKWACSCDYTRNFNSTNCFTGGEIGRHPSNVQTKNLGGKNCIPLNGVDPYATTCTREDTECCSGSGTCSKKWTSPPDAWPIGVSQMQCCAKVNWATCGEKPFVTSGSGIRSSGHRWINFTSVNANAWGGWNWKNWHICHNGSGSSTCFANLRSVGTGGKPARVCAGPCCCGGPGINGAIIWKYR